jgi:hypothetical protein
MLPYPPEESRFALNKRPPWPPKYSRAVLKKHLLCLKVYTGVENKNVTPYTPEVSRKVLKQHPPCPP